MRQNKRSTAIPTTPMDIDSFFAKQWTIPQNSNQKTCDSRSRNSHPIYC